MGLKLLIIFISINLPIIDSINRVIVYSMKCQKSANNAHFNVPEPNVTFQIASFVQTTAQNTNTPHLFS